MNLIEITVVLPSLCDWKTFQSCFRNEYSEKLIAWNVSRHSAVLADILTDFGRTSYQLLCTVCLKCGFEFHINDKYNLCQFVGICFRFNTSWLIINQMLEIVYHITVGNVYCICVRNCKLLTSKAERINWLLKRDKLFSRYLTKNKKLTSNTEFTVFCFE